jgi:surface protein
MKAKIIVANSLRHLEKLVQEEMIKNGNKCDLNHIDVSNITDMGYLFCHSKFNGNINSWDVSNVTDMSRLFKNSNFNGDISNWNVSNVKTMYAMFENSKFRGDLSKWTPYSVEDLDSIFLDCPIKKPYWFVMGEKQERQRIINSYQLNKELEKDLSYNKNHEKKLKV